MNRRFALVCALAAASSCARVSSPLAAISAATASVDLATHARRPARSVRRRRARDDMAVPPDLTLPSICRHAADLAIPRDLASPSDLATPPDLVVVVASCHLVINEVQTGTTQTGTEEFVELYNPCSSGDHRRQLQARLSRRLEHQRAHRRRQLDAHRGARPAASPPVATASWRQRLHRHRHGDLLVGHRRVRRRRPPRRGRHARRLGRLWLGHCRQHVRREPRPRRCRRPLASPGGSIERMPNGTRQRRQQPRLRRHRPRATPGAANH